METFSFSYALTLYISINIFALTSSKKILNSTTDQDALLAFKNSITSSPNAVEWSVNSSVCYWTGVSCSIKHQRVTALNLSGIGLRGTLAPHLGNLTFLQSLDVSSNNFTGSVPSELSKLRCLKEIKAATNGFTGEIPSGIFTDMPELVEIDLRYNKLSGQLPKDMCRNTPKLRIIHLRNNQLSGKIPRSIHECREVEKLNLAKNQLEGSIPNEIGNLTKLTLLSLFENHFQGGIPKEIGYLTSLNYLYLDGNNLTGNIPKEMGNLTSLVELDLAVNKLTGELPEELGDLARLKYLSAGFNDFLNGSIPSSIFNLSELATLSLQQNQLSGVLPSSMGNSLPNLEKLYLFWNKFSGEIPRSINNASKLTTLELNNNSFTGSIPDFGNLRLLEVLRLWMNNLTSPNQELGFLSSLTNSPNLKYLEISFNPHLNGILPPSIGNLSSSSLVTFEASDCNIRGIVPFELGNLSSLLTLDLSRNRLTGLIPTTLGKLKQLGKFYLDDNQLQGSIPHHLCQMSNLVELNLSGNTLTGPIPECLGRLKSIRTLSFASNNLNSTLPSNFFNLVDLISLDLSSNSLVGQLPSQIGRLRAINWLGLSSNKLRGSIPESIGSCTSLETLILSNNLFDGTIPESLGEVKALGALDLSYNNLSGTIPDSLAELHLKDFNVSYNKLEGEIPDKGYFKNLSAQSFLHNSALCGAARFQVSTCGGKPRSKIIAQVLKFILPAFVAVMILAIGIITVIRRCTPKKSPPKTDISPVGAGWKVVSERELKQGTNSFSETNLIGRGSFGSVFKATLSDGIEVAVKVFNLQSEGAVESFVSESHILSAIRHRNLAKILGCCSNHEFKALILAYMPRGSLEKWLHSDDQFVLDLMQRVNIAIDVALALEYLHLRHTFPVVHRDIKPSNVLLDEDMTAHVGDFGISKLFENDEAAVHTLTMATVGYAAPEFGTEGKVSTSGDVYSYGILLLEIFTSKSPVDDMFDEEMGIKEWVEKALQENAINEIVAPTLLSREDRHFSVKLECLTSIFELAMKCLAFSPGERINMVQVLAALHKIKSKFQ